MNEKCLTMKMLLLPLYGNVLLIEYNTLQHGQSWRACMHVCLSNKWITFRAFQIGKTSLSSRKIDREEQQQQLLCKPREIYRQVNIYVMLLLHCKPINANATEKFYGCFYRRSSHVAAVVVVVVVVICACHLDIIFFGLLKFQCNRIVYFGF